MKRLCLSITLVLVLFDCFSQIAQFPQTPVSLNPSLAGSASSLRLAMAVSYLNQKLDGTFNYNNGMNLPYKNQNQYSLTTINIDKFVSKIYSGIGFTLNAGYFNKNLDTEVTKGQIQKIENENKMLQIGICIAPKFTFAMEDNRNILKSTWSPAFELNFKTVNVNNNINYKNINYGNKNNLINISSLGYRLGISRIGKKSILGVYYAYQKKINVSNVTYEVKTFSPITNQDIVYNTSAEEDVFRFNDIFGIHYGLTMYLNSSKTFVYIPHLNLILSLSDSFTQGNLTEIGYNQINIVNNFRYKKVLAGLSLYSNGSAGGIPISIGYQSSTIKIIASYDLLNANYGEITCSYIFK